MTKKTNIDPSSDDFAKGFDRVMTKALSSRNLQIREDAKDYFRKRKAGKSIIIANSSNLIGVQPPRRLNFALMREIGNTPLIAAIIETRLHQIRRFSNFSFEPEKEGWAIRRKIRLKEDPRKKPPKAPSPKVVEEIGEMLFNCGCKERRWNMDYFPEFLQKFSNDIMLYDQGTFEVVATKKKVFEFFATDGTSYEIIPEKDAIKLKKVDGFYPKYKQKVEYGEQGAVFYPWELCFAARNITTNVNKVGYGRSELEVLVKHLTWLTNSETYNGTFFRNGSAPRGFFNFKDGTNAKALEDLRRDYAATALGVDNANKIQFFAHEGLEWIDMQKTNNDMQWQSWIDHIVRAICSVYRMDPSEIGYEVKGAPRLMQGSEREKFNASVRKGLYPILIFMQSKINQHLINPFYEGYEFYFTGLSKEDPDALIDDRVKSMNYKTFDEIRQEQNLEPLEKFGNVIANPIYAQMVQAEQFGGEESNDYVDEEGENPEDDEVGFEPNEEIETEEDESPEEDDTFI